jgi:hypothetical protein
LLATGDPSDRGHLQLLLSFLQLPLRHQALGQPHRGGRAERVQVLRRLKVESGGRQLLKQQLLVAELSDLRCLVTGRVIIHN